MVLNIAEGSGKASLNDRKNYFTIARGSVFECVAVNDILKDEKKDYL
ncbi:MAG: four helix bundle protein [Bacteroidetes bacterium]|nr:four helix bundle protein [Bacteroidota bacterium]MBK7587363.1 four helix bundle protein [Bacteroidota bacterium]MBK8329882.1 four helix bundle protein [Bacteroidota bacterium]